jgi:protein O-GlcNAc transferase
MTPGTACAPAKLARAPAHAASVAASIAPEGSCELARAHADAGRLSEARDLLVFVLSTRPDYYPAFVQLARVLLQVGHSDEAVACLRQAAALAPEMVEIPVEIANTLAQAGRHALAAEAWLDILKRRPAQPGWLNNLGLSLAAAGRSPEAEQAYRHALDLAPDLPEAQANLASLLQVHGRFKEARDHYRLAVAAKPDWPEPWNNLGVTARALGDAEEGETALRQAVRLNPRYVEAQYNLGNALSRPGTEHEARACYAAAIALKPDHAEALYGLATATVDLAAALEIYQRALSIRPGFPEALVGYACAKLKACEWNGLAGVTERITALVREHPAAAVAPFSFLQISGDPALQQACARNWTHNKVEPVAHRLSPLAALTTALDGPRRLRLGYLSGDLRNHAVGNLAADLFRLHDRSRFEVFGYSSGPDDGSPTRARIVQGFDCLLDVRHMSPGALAERIRADGIDILVDLAGYTEHSRSEVLALRLAPVQASYLGFPGTLGAGWVDALISDAFLTPEPSRHWYDERLVLLPLCYQINSEPQAMAVGPVPTRGALGLPEDGFVFCCFNNSYKIQPSLFAAWMHILLRTPGSVLWLAEFNPLARGNLWREAAAHGVDPKRLVFSAVVPVEQHTQRLPAADLFLDTFPYSAGATASQTLRAGVPLLTLIGDAYVSRMAGSLLNALDLPELLASSLAEYEETAVALAGDRTRMAEIRARSAEAQTRTKLFRPERGTRALEAGYEALWAEHLRGEQSVGIRAPLFVAGAAG